MTTFSRRERAEALLHFYALNILLLPTLGAVVICCRFPALSVALNSG